MAFATLRDFNGEVDLTFFSAVWEKCKLKIDEKKIVALKGRINRYNGKTSFKVSRVLSMDHLERAVGNDAPTSSSAPERSDPANTAVCEPADAGSYTTEESAVAPSAEAETSAVFTDSEVHIRLRNGFAGMETSLFALRDALLLYAGACVVFIHIPQGSREVVIRPIFRANAAAADKLRALAAVADVWFK
jgi:hypothetical protein